MAVLYEPAYSIPGPGGSLICGKFIGDEFSTIIALDGNEYTALTFDGAQTFQVPAGKLWTISSYGVYVVTVPGMPTWSFTMALCGTTAGVPNVADIKASTVFSQASNPGDETYWTDTCNVALLTGTYAIVLYNFSPAGTDYYQVQVDGPPSGDEDNYILGAVYLRDDTTAWTLETNEAITPKDASFKIEGVESVAVPGKAENPTPADDATAQSLQLATLSWDEGSPVADTMNVYFGLAGSMVLLSWAQAGTTCSVPYTLAWATEYEWRVDTTNAEGTTTGDTWSFTTIGLLPPVDRVTYKRLVAAANNKIWYENI